MPPLLNLQESAALNAGDQVDSGVSGSLYPGVLLLGDHCRERFFFPYHGSMQGNWYMRGAKLICVVTHGRVGVISLRFIYTPVL